MPEDAGLLGAFRAEWELAEWRAQARMESCVFLGPALHPRPERTADLSWIDSLPAPPRILHLLHVHGEIPSTALVADIPPLIHGFVVALSSSPEAEDEQEERGAEQEQQVWEVVLSVLGRWGRVGWEVTARGRGDGQARLAGCVRMVLEGRRGRRVLRLLREKGVALEVSSCPLMRLSVVEEPCLMVRKLIVPRHVVHPHTTNAAPCRNASRRCCMGC